MRLGSGRNLVLARTLCCPSTSPRKERERRRGLAPAGYPCGQSSVKTVLFLGASVSQVAAIRQARMLGFRVVAVDGNPEALGFADADIAEPVDFSDVERVVEVGRKYEVAGIVAIATDRAVPIAAAIADRLGLPGIGVEVAHRMTNKIAMRRRLQARGLPQPSFLEVLGTAIEAAAVERIGFPAVLKPADSGGQRGVFKVRTLGEFRQRLPETLAFSRSNKAILERYIEGRELNGIAVVRAGHVRVITLSDRLRPPGRGFGVGWIHLYPSVLDSAAREVARNLAASAVTALGLRDGIAFPQLLVTEDGDPYVVEVAARIPAGQMADVVHLGTGVDLVEIAIAQAVGLPIQDAQITPKFERPIAVRFLTASPGFLPVGTVRAVDGIEQIRTAPGVLKADLYILAGETIRPVQVDEDRRGYIIATAPTPLTALELAQQAARKLIVQVEPTE